MLSCASRVIHCGLITEYWPQPAPPLVAPATVVMIPFVTFLTRQLLLSAINRSPAASTATLIGSSRVALVAGPPSPTDVPKVTLMLRQEPATVEMMPAETLRMQSLRLSAINRSPDESTAKPWG